MYLDSELSDKKGWGHSSIEQGVFLADKIKVKNFLLPKYISLTQKGLDQLSQERNLLLD